MDKIYVNDLVENKDGRLYIVYEVSNTDLGVLSVPIGYSHSWIDIKDVKKIGNYPYLIRRLQYVKEKLDEKDEFELFVIRELLNRADKETVKKDSIMLRLAENKSDEWNEEVLDEYDYGFYGDNE